jgi:hypothetical protein
MNGPLDPAEADLPREADGGGQGGGECYAEGFQLSWCTDQVKRPGHPTSPASEAKDGSLVRPVEDGPRHFLKLPADGVYDEQVRLILPHSHHIIHVGLHSLLKVRKGDPREHIL